MCILQQDLKIIVMWGQSASVNTPEFKLSVNKMHLKAPHNSLLFVLEKKNLHSALTESHLMTSFQTDE